VKYIIPGLFLLFAIVLVVGCKFTTTTSTIKDPLFKNQDTLVLEAKLDSLITCERVEIKGRDIKTNGVVSSVLEIDVLNGANVPNDYTQMNTLAKMIASFFKKILMDPNEYDTYKVFFITVKTNSGITQKNWNVKSFKSAEL
jgi:hypothetical protein